MKRVLWISRHEMTPEQFQDLERVMGEPVTLLPWRETVSRASELLPLMDQCDAIAAVLPPELLEPVLELAGEKPVLRSLSARKATGKTHTLCDGRTEQEFAFIHQGWEQILEFRCRTRRL